ncbi:hypothetical protein [Streptomyces aurantiogriseus]|uniref:Uncharacterized protein n=1 Tax=Streptomyces aurantiogriseus TaxID=66870 RepID=A0A918L0C7_9ACTN|nr:hypothetical protein [Streptomyces aurantiogriseus]GGR64545.1 hypothetical protein GCM10010251_96390 [Streptomyces aurantiogriseus]
MSELELRFKAKIQRARENFAKATDRLSDSEKTAVIAGLCAAALPNRWPLRIPADCPACQSPSVGSGRDKSGDYGAIWFFPRHLGCRVCGLTLTGQELDLADIKSQTLNEEPDLDPDWEPDFDLM